MVGLLAVEQTSHLRVSSIDVVGQDEMAHRYTQPWPLRRGQRHQSRSGPPMPRNHHLWRDHALHSIHKLRHGAFGFQHVHGAQGRSPSRRSGQGWPSSIGKRGGRSVRCRRSAGHGAAASTRSTAQPGGPQMRLLDSTRNAIKALVGGVGRSRPRSGGEQMRVLCPGRPSGLQKPRQAGPPFAFAQAARALCG